MDMMPETQKLMQSEAPGRHVSACDFWDDFAELDLFNF
jgi:hypothetical protein